MRWPTRIALAAIGVVVVYVALAALADVRAVRGSLAGFDGRALALALALASAAAIVRALRWRVYLARMGVRAFGPATSVVMGLASGKSGQVVKAYYLQRDAGVPYRVCVPATFAERIADTVSLLLFLVLALALVPRFDAIPALAVGAGVIVALLLLRHERAARALAAPLLRMRWLAAHRARIAESYGHLRAHLTARDLAAPAALGLAGYALDALALVALAEGIARPIGFGGAALAVALANVAALVTFIPGGIGVAEGGLVVVLALFGMPLADAAALTLLFRLCTLWYSLALGGLAALVLQAERPRKAEREEPPPA